MLKDHRWRQNVIRTLEKSREVFIKVNSSLTSIQRRDNQTHNCKMVFCYQLCGKVARRKGPRSICLPVFFCFVLFFSSIYQILLRRSGTPEGKYIHGIGSSFDQDLFLIIWGPTVAALSYVYDNGLEKSVVQKAIVGFRYSTIILFLLSCITRRSHWEVSAVVKDVFECKYDNENSSIINVASL